MQITNSTISGIGSASHWIAKLIASHSYIAIIFLMTLESASLPIPSEIILPVSGHLAYLGYMNIWLVLIASMIGTFLGITIDYYIAYVFGKDVVYKHLSSFHIKRRSLDSFDGWFSRNGPFTVFVARLIPVVRGLISLPAGFAKMDLKKFYLYSLAGSLIWNVALLWFGYYALAVHNFDLTITILGLLMITLYLIYHFSMKRMKRSR